MKRCPCCGETKSINEFPRNRRTKSGIATYCKVCHNAKGSESRERGGGARKYATASRMKRDARSPVTAS